MVLDAIRRHGESLVNAVIRHVAGDNMLVVIRDLILLAVLRVLPDLAALWPRILLESSFAPEVVAFVGDVLQGSSVRHPLN